MGPGLIGLAEIGHFSLALGLASALVMATLPLIGAQTGNGEMLRAGRMAAGLLTAQVLLAFIMLTIAFLRSDFSVELVASHSHSLKPLLYKISGVWGNHEGSLLLWVLILSLFSLMVALRRSIEPRRQGRVLAVQGMIAVAFLLFVLLTSNPFCGWKHRRLMATGSTRCCRTRPRLSSADALHRLCRAFSGLQLCCRRPARRQG